MKRVKQRTVFTLVLVIALIAGMALLLFRYVVNGNKWAGFTGNQAVYSDGQLSSGGIYDRNGTLLYDAASNEYNADSELRTATLHVVGDRQGMIATSALSKFSGMLSGFNPVTGTTMGGSNLYLTIDAELNRTAYEAMDGYKGTVAVYNYKTGEIVCLVSTPAYDPDNVPTISDDDSTWTGVYVNRFYSSTYTPGSTFKIVTLAACMEQISGLMDRTFTCSGSINIGGNDITCPSVHGTMDITEAFAHSCNCTFGTLADELGASTLARYVKEAGLTENHSVSGITTAAGSFVEEPDANMLAWSGIGQAEDLVNPCAMLRLMGAIANGGTPVEPRILLKQESSELKVTVNTFSSDTGDKIFTETTCGRLVDMMRNNVIETYGQDRFGDLAVCAKSGTAETNADHPTSWFVGFVNDDDYPYAFVAVCEDSGSGSKVAGNVAAAVLNAIEAGQ